METFIIQSAPGRNIRNKLFDEMYRIIDRYDGQEVSYQRFVQIKKEIEKAAAELHLKYPMCRMPYVYGLARHGMEPVDFEHPEFAPTSASIQVSKRSTNEVVFYLNIGKK